MLKQVRNDTPEWIIRQI